MRVALVKKILKTIINDVVLAKAKRLVKQTDTPYDDQALKLIEDLVKHYLN